MQTRIGFSLQTQYDRPLAQVIALLKENGFSAVSPLWSPELDLASLSDCVKSHDMTVQSLHAPHKGIAQLWEPDSPSSLTAQQWMLRSLDACARFQIPILVVHGWQGLSYTFPDTPLNFRFFDSLVLQAQRLGVCIAFENLEGEEYLDALMTRYRGNRHVGFCWDSGHAHCYPHRMDFLKAYGDRLLMTHLNDNYGLRDPAGTPSGNDDLHFLPYDGNLDWNRTLAELTHAPRQGILNFEFKTRSHSAAPQDLLYAHMPLEKYIAAAGIRARQIAEDYDTMLSGM